MFWQYRSLEDPLSGIDITLWMITIILAFVFAIYTLFKIYIKESEMRELQKTNAITWAIAFIFFGISNILNTIWRYSIADAGLAVIVENVSVFFLNFAVLIKIFHTEYMIHKYGFYKRYYSTIASLCLVIFTSIVTPDMVREIFIFQVIYLVLLLAGVSIFPGIFLFLAFKLSGRERLMAIRILGGLLLLSMGMLLQPQNIETYASDINDFSAFSSIMLILCPILVSIAFISIFRSYKNNL